METDVRFAVPHASGELEPYRAKVKGPTCKEE